MDSGGSKPGHPGSSSENFLLTVASAVESQIDAQILELENLDDTDFEKLREKRLEEMKREAGKRQIWKAKGQGVYGEISSEKEFFKRVKESERVVCHFFRENWPCKVLDKHLDELAKDHLETLFIKINAEKSPFLTEKLKISVLPTLALVLNAKVDDYVVGFDQLGGTDDFKTEILEGRLAKSNVIFLEGNSVRQKNKNNNIKSGTKSVRRGEWEGDSDSE